jgi:hypothetical protein
VFRAREIWVRWLGFGPPRPVSAGLNRIRISG